MKECALDPTSHCHGLRKVQTCVPIDRTMTSEWANEQLSERMCEIASKFTSN